MFLPVFSVNHHGLGEDDLQRGSSFHRRKDFENLSNQFIIQLQISNHFFFVICTSLFCLFSWNKSRGGKKYAPPEI